MDFNNTLKTTIQKVNVLSLFDGMACGMLAFDKLGITVENYYAYEVDKYAIKTVSHNFAKIRELGDVFNGDFTQYKNIDFLIGGSPCTYWSIAQSPDRREKTASGLGWELFSQYVRALHEAQPKFFLYENNKSMSKEIYNSISEMFGFEPICINSALVSAQNRHRLYWVGKRNDDGTYSKVDIKQPEDKGIFLKDVLDSGIISKDKSYCVTTHQGTTRDYFKKGQSNISFEPITLIKELSEREMDYMVRETKPTFDGRWNYCQRPAQDEKSKCLVANVSKGVPYNVVAEKIDLLASKQVGALPRPNGNLSTSQAFRIYDINGKSVTLKAGGGGAGGKTGLYAIPIEFDDDVPTKAVNCTDGKTYRIYKVYQGMITVKGIQYPIKLIDGYYIIRKLSVSECKKLQTVPEWYEFPVSDSQAYKMLGNGWTVNVIAHILRSIFYK